MQYPQSLRDINSIPKLISINNNDKNLLIRNIDKNISVNRFFKELIRQKLLKEDPDSGEVKNIRGDLLFDVPANLLTNA